MKIFVDVFHCLQFCIFIAQYKLPRYINKHYVTLLRPVKITGDYEEAITLKALFMSFVKFSDVLHLAVRDML